MSKPALEIRDLTVGYGDVSVLRGLSMKVEPGQLVALIGANGAGKTTLLRTTSGLLRPSAGSIQLDGVGHYVAQEAPDALADALIGTFARSSA